MEIRSFCVIILLFKPSFVIRYFCFSNSLIIHQVKTKNITPWRRFGYPVLISIDFDDFTSPCTPFSFCFDWEAISNTRDSVSSDIQTPRISSKILRCASYFQLSSRCLDIPMKHCLSCLIYYFPHQCTQPDTFVFKKIRQMCIFLLTAGDKWNIKVKYQLKSRSGTILFY